MKLDHCKQHAGSDDDSLNCYRIRHDDGRPASDYEVMSHIGAQAADLARISAELGLPPTIGPAPGYLAGLIESVRDQAAEIERLAEYNQTRTDELSASVAQCVAQRTEIDRLRADALRYLYICKQDFKDRQWFGSFDDYKRQSDECLNVAMRAAMKDRQ